LNLFLIAEGGMDSHAGKEKTETDGAQPPLPMDTEEQATDAMEGMAEVSVVILISTLS
jgi:hypothetical protein